jgi:hypothetical protein
MGLAQWRRRRRLARKANALALRFAVDDPFDIPARHPDMLLFGSGHSLMIHNMTHGQLEGWAVRAFDFHCEAGHGTGRMTRRYDVILVELPRSAPSLLVWPQGQFWTLAADADGQIGPWNFVGPRALAQTVVERCRCLGLRACFQVCGTTVMAAMPRGRRTASYFDVMTGALKIANGVLDASAQPGPEARQAG